MKFFGHIEKIGFKCPALGGERGICCPWNNLCNVRQHFWKWTKSNGADSNKKILWDFFKYKFTPS